MKINTNIAIKAGFLLSLVLLSTVIYFSHSFFAHYTRQDKEENYVFRVIVTLDELLKSLRDERAAQRDFLTSNEKRFLEAYNSNMHQVERHLSTLQGLTANNEKYRHQLVGITQLIQKRQKALDEGIKNNMHQNIARGTIGEIIEQVSTLKQYTIRDLQESSVRQQHSLKIIWFMLVANSIFVIILVSVIFLLLRRDIDKRTLEGLELSKHRDQLDLLVTHRTEELLAANQLLQAEMRVRKQAEDSLHKLNAHMETIREEERVAFSRDIHDEIGQSLTAMKLDIGWLEHKFLPENSEVIERLNMMRSSLNRLINKTQNIIADLRPPLLDNLGPLAAVEWQVKEFRRRSGINCHLHLDRMIPALTENAAITVIRILIEALTNISRHARATSVTVSLIISEAALILEISDNGCGIPPDMFSSPKSYGLMGMQERAHLCKGALTFKGAPDAGTTVHLFIPMEYCRSSYETDSGC